MVLLYNSRHRKFPRKLHTRWMETFVIDQVFDNVSLQLKHLQGIPLDTKINESHVKLYRRRKMRNKTNSKLICSE